MWGEIVVNAELESSSDDDDEIIVVVVERETTNAYLSLSL